MIALLLSTAWGAPVFGVTRGLYDAPFTLEIVGTDGGTLYVSTDGTVPTAAYTGPVEVTTTTIVRAFEVDPAGVASDVVTHTYLFPADVATSSVMDATIVQDPTWGPEIEESLRTLPSVSLVVTPALTMTEAAASLEWIDPAGESDQVPVGAAIVGGTSYVYPKSSIRLSFRAAYGEGTWDFDPFGADANGVEPAAHHDQLTLRSGNHDTVHYLGARGQQLRNMWMDESKLDMGRLSLHGRFVHLYLNGVHHGVYHLRERGDAAFMAHYLGGTEDDYEAINGGSAFDGAGTAWAALVAASGDFETARTWLNVEDYLDYMLLNYYAANAWDWTYWHNWIAAGPTEPGQGGFVFQSSDSDICLYYDYTTNILSLGGPSDVFLGLLAEGHPDFRVALADAIHRTLEGDGALTAENASERYERLAASLEGAIAVESARWGYGWWNPTVWAAERDNLLTNFFPYRTDALLGQVRAAGWYPLDAPELDVAEGVVTRGTVVHVTPPDGSTAELWVATDGEDPRVSGGDLADGAVAGPLAVTLDRSTVVKARLRDGDVWGPIAEAFYEVDEAPAVVLNEWNAVDADEVLEGGDATLGTRTGNGGDWIELLVLRDVDLRGWRITTEDRRGDSGTIVLSDADVLADVRAGTILTIAEDLPEDAAYDPDRGDWRFHLRVAPDGAYAASDGFDVTARDWRLTLWDADGFVAFGPVGETVAPERGLGDDEVGLLAADPGDALRRDGPEFVDATRSTYGAPNEWGQDGVQDLSALRGDDDDGGVVDLPADTGSGAPRVEDEALAPEGCGCGTGSSAGWAFLAGLALALRRRTPLFALVGCAGGATVATDDPVDSGEPPAADCFLDVDADGWGAADRPAVCGEDAVPDAGDCDDHDPDVNPGAAEVCGGVDEDCDGAEDEDAIDGLPFWPDADGDGYGDEAGLVTACAVGAGLALVGGDCDDADATLHPGAAEACDDVDQDCDGVAGDGVGLSSECAGESCLAILQVDPTAADGAYWLALPSGSVTAVQCDMTGGGWTLGFTRNSAHTGSQADFGSGEQTLGDLATSPADASASATPVMGWQDLNALAWDELHLSGYGGGALAYTSRDVPRAELRLSFGEDGYYLYGGDSGYYWCGGSTAYTDGGLGATDNPAGAPADCKYHGSLGSGWDFSESQTANAGLTLCGGDGSSVMTTQPGASWTYFGTVGAAQAIWVR